MRGQSLLVLYYFLDHGIFLLSPFLLAFPPFAPQASKGGPLRFYHTTFFIFHSSSLFNTGPSIKDCKRNLWDIILFDFWFDSLLLISLI